MYDGFDYRGVIACWIDYPDYRLEAYVAREIMLSLRRLKWNEYPNGSRLG